MNCRTTIVFLILAALCPAHVASAQAYCALRDPAKQIYEQYPEATTYRSIVRTVGREHREAVQKEVGFTLHFNELGRHTLYVSVKEQTPIGLVHVRSERGRWGLTEIAWAIDLDMCVVDFRFQRCRDKSRTLMEADAIRKQFKGLSLVDLRAMLDEDGDALRPDVLAFPEGGERLATMLVRSAVKTLSVTSKVWEEDLDVIRVLNHAFTSFPDGHSVEPVKDVYSTAVLKALEQAACDESSFERANVEAVRVLNEAGDTVGMSICTRWHVRDDAIEMWWDVTPDLEIASVMPKRAWPDTEFKNACEALRGLGPTDVESCATPVQLAGLEVLTICEVIGAEF